MKVNAHTLQVNITIVMGIALTILMETAFVMNSPCTVVRTPLLATMILTRRMKVVIVYTPMNVACVVGTALSRDFVIVPGRRLTKGMTARVYA